MRTLFSISTIAVLLLFIYGYSTHQNDELTPQQKEIIKKEIKTVWDSILAKWARLDTEGCLQYFSPELIVVEGDTRHTFEEYKKLWIEYDRSITLEKVTSVREDYIVCSKDLVITTWLLKDDLLMKSGDRVTFDPITYTLVFRNYGGKWKGIYSHISGSPIIQHV